MGNFKTADEIVDYKQGDTVLEGFVSHPDAKDVESERHHPAVVLVHEWMGLGSYTKARAKQVASELGYVAFAADIYGKGVRAHNMEEAGKLATIYKNDRVLLRGRVNAAIDAVKKRPGVDPNRVVVMGYCFGGTAALEAARSGAAILGTVSFHGGLSTPNLADAKNIKGRVLILHGAEDPLVSADEVRVFEEEMRAAHVDYELVKYGGAVHSFTNWETPYKEGAPFGYNEKADQRSWTEFKTFLNDIFKK